MVKNLSLINFLICSDGMKGKCRNERWRKRIECTEGVVSLQAGGGGKKERKKDKEERKKDKEEDASAAGFVKGCQISNPEKERGGGSVSTPVQ